MLSSAVLLLEMLENWTLFKTWIIQHLIYRENELGICTIFHEISVSVICH